MTAYSTPTEGMKSFLVETITKLNGVERLENQALARFLIDKCNGKTEFNTNNIGDSFPWLNQIGVLSYNRVYEPSGGWRLHLYRACSAEDVERLISVNGDIVVEDKGPTPIPPNPKPKPKPKKIKARKQCCDTPHVVKSKKTGKRKCKNCGKPYPDKEPAALASCCDNPHPVKSKKTGARKCRNCGNPLPKKKSQ